MKLLFAAAFLLVAGCTNKHTDNAFQMDYPVDASRLSLGGDIHVNIDCATKPKRWKLFQTVATEYSAAI